MTTAKLFKLGKAQAVRIPARFRLDATEVEITEQDGGLFLRPKPRSALDALRAAQALMNGVILERPPQGDARPIEPLNL